MSKETKYIRAAVTPKAHAYFAIYAQLKGYNFNQALNHLITTHAERHPDEFMPDWAKR